MKHSYNSSRRFLILTSDSGFGHRSAANSVARALNYLHPDEANVFIINPLAGRSVPLIIRKSEHDYDRTVLKTPTWYRFTYEISDSRAASSLVESTLVLSLYRNLKQILDEVQPDAVLSTNELFSAPLGALRRYGKQRFPFFTVVTDLADVHALWFNPNPDLLFVASEDVKEQAVGHGIRAEQVVVSGIPVDIAFARGNLEHAKMRRQLGIEPDLRTILFVGSNRVNGIYKNMTYLEDLKMPFQVIAIAGGNEEMYAKIAARQWKYPVHLEKFVTNMPDWMAASDILVTKAGGLILSEGMAAGLPAILIDNLPGQESGNVRYILEHNAGARVENRYDFLAVLNRWLGNNGAYLKTLTEQVRKIGHPGSALEIADLFWNSTHSTFERVTARYDRNAAAYFQGKNDIH